MTEETATAAERPRGGGVWLVSAGLLAGGMAALAVALFLPTAPARADGLPVWVRVAVAALLAAGVGVVVLPRWRARPESPWTDSRRWRVALGLGAAAVGTWAVVAFVADIRSGLPGQAIPVLAVGCVALLAATVLLAVPAPVPARRRSVARQALPAAVALVTVAAAAVALDVAGWRIPVEATTAERVDPAGVPDPPGAVSWTSTWPIELLNERLPDPVEVVAAGAGVVVASGDRVVALDGSTGAERWHYRRAGTRIFGLTASPDGRTVVADIDAGGEERSSGELFAFDANTGEVRWSRPSEWGAAATDHVLVVARLDSSLVGVDLGSGEELWDWAPPAGCEDNGAGHRSPDAVLVPVVCRDRAGAESATLIGIDDRTGTERWRYTAPGVTGSYALSDAELTTAPDGRAAMYRPRDPDTDPVLLDAATGAVLYRANYHAEIVGPDEDSLVLRREVPGADAKLVLRDLSTGAEHPLASTCPVLRQPVQPGSTDEGSMLVRSVLTSGSVLVLCFDGREGATPRATVDVYSRSDGTRKATVTATDDVGAIHAESSATGLIAAPGAAVVVVQHFDAEQAMVVGLA
jgi:outer membrane protein assembly factor BamB